MLSNGSEFGKKVIIFFADLSSFKQVHNRNEEKNKCPRQRLDDTALTLEKEYAMNVTKQQKNFCLSLHYNSENSYLFVNNVEI